MRIEKEYLPELEAVASCSRQVLVGGGLSVGQELGSGWALLTPPSPGQRGMLALMLGWDCITCISWLWHHLVLSACSKINELEEELKVVGNNMKSLEISEQEVKTKNLKESQDNYSACFNCCYHRPVDDRLLFSWPFIYVCISYFVLICIKFPEHPEKAIPPTLEKVGLCKGTKITLQPEPKPLFPNTHPLRVMFWTLCFVTVLNKSCISSSTYLLVLWNYLSLDSVR